MDNLRIFLLHFYPMAMPGLLLLSLVLIYTGLTQRRERPMTQKEIDKVLPLLTRKATTFDLYRTITKQ